MNKFFELSSSCLMGDFEAGNWMNQLLKMLKWMALCCICKMSKKKRLLKRNLDCISTQVKMWTCKQLHNCSHSFYLFV